MFPGSEVDEKYLILFIDPSFDIIKPSKLTLEISVLIKSEAIQYFGPTWAQAENGQNRVLAVPLESPFSKFKQS